MNTKQKHFSPNHSAHCRAGPWSLNPPPEADYDVGFPKVLFSSTEGCVMCTAWMFVSTIHFCLPNASQAMQIKHSNAAINFCLPNASQAMQIKHSNAAIDFCLPNASQAMQFKHSNAAINFCLPNASQAISNAI